MGRYDQAITEQAHVLMQASSQLFNRAVRRLRKRLQFGHAKARCESFAILKKPELRLLILQTEKPVALPAERSSSGCIGDMPTFRQRPGQA